METNTGKRETIVSCGCRPERGDHLPPPVAEKGGQLLTARIIGNNKLINVEHLYDVGGQEKE